MREFEGKFVYIRCNNGRVYSGRVIEINYLGDSIDKIPKWLIVIRDKYDLLVGINSGSILVIEQENEFKLKKGEQNGSRTR